MSSRDLFVYVNVLVDDAIGSRAVAIAPRPGPAPACSDAELTIALVRHVLGRRSEAGFLAEVARDSAGSPRRDPDDRGYGYLRWLAVMPSTTFSSAGSHCGQISNPVSRLCPSTTTRFAGPGSPIRMIGGGSRPTRRFSAICR